MAHLVNSLDPLLFDLCLVQEPHFDFLNRTRAPNGWRIILPESHERDNPEEKIRSTILVSPRLDTSYWSEMKLDSPDLTAITIWGDFGTIHIINAYIDCNNSLALHSLANWLNRRPDTPLPARDRSFLHPSDKIILLGDFNCHHPIWEEDSNNHLFTTRALELAQPLLDIIARHSLSLALPKGVPTLEHSRTKNWTRPDNVFISDDLTPQITLCNVDAGRRPPKADHLPILTTLDLSPKLAPVKNKRNWKKADWELFRDFLSQALRNGPPPGGCKPSQTWKPR
jgi:hypothetical protein